MSGMKTEDKRILAVYATYDVEGKVDEYILYALCELKKVVNEIYIVSNNRIHSEDKKKLFFVDRIYEREDVGFDIGGFAYVMGSIIAENRLNDYEEIVFMNDSVFGPFYPFEEMFSKMNQQKDIDFWGITKRGVSDFDGGEALYPEHIQLYFYVVRKKMIQSQAFQKYWGTIQDTVTDFRSAIINYEFTFTKYFADRGFRWNVYCHTDDYITENPLLNLSPYHYCSYELIKDKKCPLLKRKLFTGDFVRGQYSDKLDVRRTVSYIENYTDYCIGLMWSHVLRVYPLEKIIEGMQMYEIIDCEFSSNLFDSSRLKVIDARGNVIKSSSCKDKAEYILFIDIEEDQNSPKALIDAKKRCVIENLALNSGYIANEIELLDDHSRLGVLIPPMNTFGKIGSSLAHRWQENTLVEELRKKYGLSVPMNGNAPIHKINAFICRSKILSQDLLNDLLNDLTGTVMQMIPLFAQQKGYYTEIVVNKNYVPSLVSNIWQVMRDFSELSFGNMKEDANIVQMQNELYRQKIEAYTSDKASVYIYGAGQLAYRIIKIVETMCKVAGIVVSDTNGNPEKLSGYPVSCIDEIDTGNGIIVAVGKKNNNNVVKRLKALQITDYLLLIQQEEFYESSNSCRGIWNQNF